MITMRAMAITVSVPASVLNTIVTVFIAPVRWSANHSDTDASSEVASPSKDPTAAPTPINVPMQSSTNSAQRRPAAPAPRNAGTSSAGGHVENTRKPFGGGAVGIASLGVGRANADVFFMVCCSSSSGRSNLLAKPVAKPVTNLSNLSTKPVQGWLCEEV